MKYTCKNPKSNILTRKVPLYSAQVKCEDKLQEVNAYLFWHMSPHHTYPQTSLLFQMSLKLTILKNALRLHHMWCSWPMVFKSRKDFHQYAIKEQAHTPFVDMQDLVLLGDDSPQLSSALKWRRYSDTHKICPALKQKTFNSRCCSSCSHTTLLTSHCSWQM